MRLLTFSDKSGLSLVKRSGNDVPAYAILSHTWGPDGEEVTYEDLVTGVGKLKPGYDKIRFCANQAKADGLQYFWIDTCCINKADFTELSEAINSMFRWYSEASRCYVYLYDVSKPQDDRAATTGESAFQSSRWFKRGWTLQELLAPSSVHFFSREGTCLGTKRSQELQIQEITGITTEALRGAPLSQISTSERLSWAEKRQTTVEEDAAYCLLGIFDIQMPLIYGEGRQKALDRLQRKIKKSLGAPVASKCAAWIVPFERNSRFTGRNPQLAQLEEMLFTKDCTTKIAVMGLGGVGKTQLVLELLYRTKEKHPDCSIIWIPATNRESLHQAYLDAARRLRIPGWEEDKENAKMLVQEYLSNNNIGKWLLVYDNADDMDMWIATAPATQPEGSEPLINYLPKCTQGAILFTTRDRALAVKLAHQHVIEVPAMGEDVATRLLEKYLMDPKLINSQQDRRTLLSELSYLPLAIVQAAAYINENGIEIADYLSLLSDQEEDVISLLSEEFEDDGRYYDIKNPVATTWLISFERIRLHDSLAADYLSFMACIEPKEIPQSLLPTGLTRKKEVDAIGTLKAYSFITKRPADTTLDLHRLVHLATRNWLRKEGLLVKSTEKALVQLEKVFPDDDHKNRTLWRMYLAHVGCVIDSPLLQKDLESRIELMWRYGLCLGQDGRWKEAEIQFSQVLAIEKRRLGVDHPSSLSCMDNLALMYWNQGRWDAAEELEMQVLEVVKKKQGHDHPDTLTTMNNLASMYSSQGRWDAAEELEVKVLESRKRKLGEDHPDTLSSMNNLALTYRDQGRLDIAEELAVQVLEIRKKMLGEDHPDTLSSMNNLASTYWNQSRWEAAEELEVKVLEIHKKKLGEDHPDTLSSMNNLALTYRDQGRLDIAEKLAVEVYEARNKKQGADHPSTLTCMNNLACTWKRQGKTIKAMCLMRQCVDRRKSILGVNHPDCISSCERLAEWEAEVEQGGVPSSSVADT